MNTDSHPLGSVGLAVSCVAAAGGVLALAVAVVE